MIKKLKVILNTAKGQSIVEYILLVAAVIAALIIFLGRGGIFEQSYNNVLQIQGSDLVETSNRVFF